MKIEAKTTGRDLPPRMLRRSKKLKSGKVWVSFYYNGVDETGKRHEIPLGRDLAEAKRKWAELEGSPQPKGSGLLNHVFDRYQREVIPLRAPRTQRDYLEMLGRLRPVFGHMEIEMVQPFHIAQYRDARSAKVRANREITLLSHVFNKAREWGLSTKENPARGVPKNKEKPRDFYVDDQVWEAVLSCACDELHDALMLSYLTGQRPADVLRMNVRDVGPNYLYVAQAKTSRKLRIQLKSDDGSLTMLGDLIEEIRARSRKVSGFNLITTPEGVALNKNTLRTRFEAARKLAAEQAEAGQTEEMKDLASRIRQFQFRDIRAKAASDIGDLVSASKLLGHTEQEITKKVYRRVGEVVKPTK